jgi:phosphoglycolate phosphatase
MTPPRPTIVFDLDGTLVDSQRDIVNSFLYAFDELGLERPSPESALANIGLPLRAMYAEFAPEEHLTALTAAYRSHYAQHFTDTTAPFPGVLELMQELGSLGITRVVATTKQSASAQALVEAVGLASVLDHVQGTDDLPAKPAPDVVLRAVGEVKGEGVLMVGDSVVDVLAGKAAGLPTYAVTWGTGTREALTEAGADAVEPDLQGVWRWLARARL